jgi:hypothetical protein
MDFEKVDIAYDLPNVLVSGDAEGYIKHLISTNRGYSLCMPANQQLYKRPEKFLVECLNSSTEDSINFVSSIRKTIYNLIFQDNNLLFYANSNKFFDAIFSKGIDYLFMEKLQNYYLYNQRRFADPRLNSFKEKMIIGLCKMNDDFLRDSYRSEIFEMFFQTPSEMLDGDEFLHFVNRNLFPLEHFKEIDQGEMDQWLFGGNKEFDVTKLDLLNNMIFDPTWIREEAAEKIMQRLEGKLNTRSLVNTFIQICKFGRTDLICKYYNKQTPLIQATWKVHPKFKELEELVNEYLEQQEI